MKKDQKGHRHGGWHKHQRSPVPSSTLGDHKPTVVFRPKPPADSWWTIPTSREEFDARAAQRWREAGWVGVGMRS